MGKEAKKADSKKPSARVNVVPRVAEYNMFARPILSERAFVDGGSRVGFRVPVTVSKDEIKAAVEKVFSVEVASVNTCRYIGKVKRVGRHQGRRAAFKKAYITLKPGHSIAMVEGV